MKKEKIEEFLFKNKKILFAFFGTILFIIPIFFLDNIICSGLCSIFGLSIILFVWRIVDTRISFIMCSILFYLSYALRFIFAFDRVFLYCLGVLLAFIPYALLITFIIILERKILKTRFHYLGVLIMPFTYGLLSFIFSILRLGFTSNILSYLMIIPTYSSSIGYLGEYVMTFFFMLIISLISYVFILKVQKLKILFLSFSVILMIVPTIVGGVKLNCQKNNNYVLKVALGTSQYMTFDDSKGIFYTLDEQINLFENEMIKAKESNADLFVLNEEFFDIKKNEENKLISEISHLVMKYQIPTLACADIEGADNTQNLNIAYYFNSKGNILFTYSKVNLIPFVEEGYFSYDTSPIYIEDNINDHNLKISCAICFDLNNELFMRKMNKNTELLLVPSWDWYNVNNEQLRTWFFSSTLNVTIIKHTLEGFSYVSTPYGIRTQTIDTRGEYEHVYIVDVPIWTK